MKHILPLLILIFQLVSCTQAAFKDKNLDPVEPKDFFTLLKWKWSSKRKDWDQDIKQKQYKPELKSVKDKYTFIGHATVLIQVDGVNILTDPIFSDRASPITFLGPKRVRPPSVKIDDLPVIDAVLISHNHFDHLDLDSLKKLSQKFPKMIILIGLANGKLLQSNGLTQFKELDWWESYEFQHLKIAFTPSMHWSARGLFDRFETLWGSYFIQAKNKKIYFAGDTGYGRHFKLIEEKYGSVDVALLPIGAYEPRWFMQNYHTNPHEAVQAMIDLKAKKAFGIHFDTFQLADEEYGQAPRDLAKALKLHYKQTGEDLNFIAPEFGPSY
jgi:L-ascorbate metabolism protein UlaG (beta-lactamase superfamily)